jgi:ASC-1-like (ASCH) protein
MMNVEPHESPQPPVRVMHLRRPHFDHVASRAKRAEVRVAYAHRRGLAPGQLIRFESEGESVLTRIARVGRYGSFAEMLGHEDAASIIGTDASREEVMTAIRAIYDDAHERLGVLAIEIERVEGGLEDLLRQPHRPPHIPTPALAGQESTVDERRPDPIAATVRPPSEELPMMDEHLTQPPTPRRRRSDAGHGSRAPWRAPPFRDCPSHLGQRARLGQLEGLEEANELVHGWRWRVEGRGLAVVFTFARCCPSLRSAGGRGVRRWLG